MHKSSIALIFSVVSLLCCSLSSANVIAPPLISAPLTPPFTPAAVIPPERTAYVAIHFEDYDTSLLSSWDSQTSFQGIRTMMATLKDPSKGNTKRDRIVLVPSHTPANVRATFEKDGLIVLEMDASLPHKDICAPKFDRIYLWSSILASKYDRVIYLDWDVLVQRPMDHLFLCGHFCMVYNSILHFVDGLMIVKPDPTVFEAMVVKYKQMRLSPNWSLGAASRSAKQHAQVQLVGAKAVSKFLVPDKSACWEHSYLFFLEWFGNMEAAPLFSAKYGQSPLPLQRLDASAQLNAMMWYEKYSWTLMRSKEYRNMSDDQEVPALSLGFTTLKPFHWGPGLFFNLGWDWSDERDKYLGITHTWFAITRVLLWIAGLLFATKGLKKFMIELYKRRVNYGQAGVASTLLGYIRNAHMKVMGPTDGYAKANDSEELVHVPTSMWSLSGYWLPTYGSDVLGIFFGMMQFLFVAYLITYYDYLIPILTAPHTAWKIWYMFHVLGIYAWNHWMYLGYHAATPLLTAQAGAELLRAAAANAQSPEEGAARVAAPLPLPAAPSAAALHYPFLQTMSVLIFWDVTLNFFMHRTFYPEFVVKMFVMFPLLLAMLISTININRAVWRSIEQARAGQNIKEKDNTDASQANVAIQMQSLLPGGDRRH